MGAGSRFVVIAGLHSPRSFFFFKGVTLQPGTNELEFTMIVCSSSVPFSFLCGAVASVNWAKGAGLNPD